MNMKDLNVFITVAEEDNLTKALQTALHDSTGCQQDYQESGK